MKTATKPKTTKTTNGHDQEPDVVQETRRMVKQQTDWKTSLAQCDHRIERAEAALEKIRRDLAIAESAHFIKSGEMLPDDSPPAKAFQEATLMLDRTRAMKAGLLKAITSSDAELEQVYTKFKLHRDQLAKDAVKGFLKSFAQARAVYRSELRKAYALAHAFNFEISLKESTVDDSLSAAVLRPIEAQDWEQDAAAKAFYQQFAAIRELGEAVERHRQDSYRRELTAKNRSHDRQLFDPMADYQVVKPFRASGKEYYPGQKVDAQSLRTLVLQHLYEARNLKMLERKDLFSR